MTEPNRTEPNRTEIILNNQDIVSENILKIKQLFPEIFCENQIDFEKLKLILGAENLCDNNERYQLNWAGKTAAYRALQSPTFNTLIPCQAESVDFDTTQNVFIEAENMEALKILQKAYAGSVKMIYIDPPYNTGKDSFIYPDKFSETRDEYAKRVGDKDTEGYLKRDGVFQGAFRLNSKDSGHYHSNWLNMMLPRLHLAKTLLREDGVILIHIDEHEYSTLDLLLSNEVFGEENNLGTIVWDKRNPKGKVGGVAQQHEFIIAFAKNKVIFSQNGGLTKNKDNAEKILKKASDLIRKHKGVNDNSQQEFKEWMNEPKNGLTGGEKAYCLIDENGRVYRTVSMAAPDKPETRSHRPLIHPITGKPCPVPAKGWRYPDETMDKLLANNQIVFGKDETTQPTNKYYLDENIQEAFSSLLYFGGSDDAMGLPFDNPKPLYVVNKFLETNTQSNDLILDFFSGSGTTAHAVMQLNAEDGGNRRYICVQLPEETDEKSEAHKAGYATIAEISKERIRRAGKHISGSLKENQNVDTGFKVFKLAQSAFKQWRQPEKRDAESLGKQLALFQNVVDETASVENMAYELALRLGFQLTDKFDFSGSVVWLNNQSGTRKTALFLETFSDELLHGCLQQSPQKIFALDRVFQGNDALKTNAFLQCQDAGVKFETL